MKYKIVATWNGEEENYQTIVDKDLTLEEAEESVEKHAKVFNIHWKLTIEEDI